MNANRKLLMQALAGALVVLGLAGCATTKSDRHVEAVNAANKHWKDIRSSNVLESAEGYFKNGDLDSAEMTLIEAVSVDPENPKLHLLAGRVALERGQLERAHGRFEKAINADETLSEARYYQGIVLERWQRHEAALKRYQEAYDMQRDNLSYLLAVSEMLVAGDRTDEAIELLADKVTYFDQSAAIRVALGQLYAMNNDTKQAVAHVREASLLAPDDKLIREQLASLYMRDRQYAKAIRLLRELTEDADLYDRRDLRHDLGEAYQAAGQRTQAQRVYLELRRSDPKDADAWHKLGELAWQDKDYSTALTASRRMMALAPDRYEGFLLCGMVYQHRGGAERALEMFDRAAELAPKRAEPLILRGITLQRQGQTGQAAAAYVQALKRQPDDQRAQQLLSAMAAVAPK